MMLSQNDSEFVINTQTPEEKEFLLLCLTKAFSFAQFSMGRTNKNWLLTGVSNNNNFRCRVLLTEVTIDLNLVKNLLKGKEND